MYPDHPRAPNRPLQIRRNLIPIIQPGTLFDLQQAHHPLRIHPDLLLRQPHQPPVRLIAPLAHHAPVEELRLPLKQRGGVVPEARRCEAQDREGGFVAEGGRRVPGLDLRAEDHAQLVGVSLPDEAGDARVQGAEQFAGEGARVVEIW